MGLPVEYLEKVQSKIIHQRGQGRGRTGDLSSFSRTLVPTELPGHAKSINIKDENRPCSDPDGTRTRDLRRDRAAR